jgi:hypothetical protein
MKINILRQRNRITMKYFPSTSYAFKRESVKTSPEIAKRQQEIFADERTEAMQRWEDRWKIATGLVTLAASCRCGVVEMSWACATDAEIQ